VTWVSRIRAAVRARFHRPSRETAWALGVFALALAVRLVWVAFVESPFDNIFSDMGGYVNRAHQTAYGHGDPAPIFATLYPPGAHLIYAIEMRMVGWEHHAPYLVLNCMWGAVVAPCTMLLALRIVPRLSVAVTLGVVAAFWYPVLCFSGFFSSEQPFAGSIALSAWLLVRQVESGKSTIALGLASSIAYLVRPQIILTLAALALVGLYVLVRRPAGAPRLRIVRLVVSGLILTATVGLGAVRYHALSGHWGLISDNSAMTRLWADTDYGKVRATYRAPDGHTSDFFFESPPKNENGEHHELYFQGYVGDPVSLERARVEFVKRMSTGERIERWLDNVRFLFVHNSLWPDSMHAGKGWRDTWQEASKAVLLAVVCPFAILGIVSCFRRPTTVLVVCTAHVLTMLIVAAFFFAEARYRIPYDIFLMLLALEGVRRFGPAIVKWIAPAETT
jgi:hypothetical protein